MTADIKLSEEFLKLHVKLHEDLLTLEKIKDKDKYIKEIIRKNQLFHSSITNELPGIVYCCRNDHNWTMEFISKGCFRLTGYRPEELILNNKISYEKIIHPEDRKMVRDDVKKSLKELKQFHLKYRIITANNRIKWVSEIGRFLPLPDYDLQLLEGFIMDITDKEQAEEALKESEEKYRLLFETSPVGIAILNDRGFITNINDAVLHFTGFKKQYLLGSHFKNLKFLLIKDVPQYVRIFTRLLLGKKIKPLLINWRHKDKRLFTGEVRISVIKKNKRILGIQGIITDITERMKIEDKLRESGEFNKTILENSPSPTLVINPDKSIRYINPALEKITGFSLKDTIGIKPPYPYWPKEMMHSCMAKLNSAMQNDIIIPELPFLNKRGQIFWVELRASPLINNGKLKYLLVNFTDITERKKAYEELERTLDDTINTLAMIVETRDPYTAGHQKRVTMLAEKISKKLNLSDEKIKLIRTSAAIHDIGKISIPTSILSKPGQLTDIEFKLIRTHPITGFNIIKKINFHYPIAQIILQHHEREDGSGYPNSLKGKDITLEAKIIGIADVVEAMSSHRPYRPALGIGMAIEEIKKNKGKLYDPKIAEACLKVITNKKFSFND